MSECDGLGYTHRKDGETHIYQFDSGSELYSGLVCFPITLESDSGVAHVLEHLVSLSLTSGGYAFRDLHRCYPDIVVNAITEAEYIGFYFVCSSLVSFHFALDTVLEATLTDSLDIHLFPQEACNPGVGEDAGRQGALLGGVVYNEMKGVYYGLARQISGATARWLYEGQTLAYEPGGSPKNIRRLRLTDVLEFRQMFLRADNCFVLTDGVPALHGLVPSESATAVFAGSLGVTSGVRRSRFRTSEAGTYTPISHEERRKFRRYLFSLGSETKNEVRFLSWAIDALFELYQPLFSTVCARSGAEFLPSLSGLEAFGSDLYLVVTVTGLAESASLYQEIVALTRHLFSSHSAAIDLSATLDECEIDLREVLSSHNAHVPTKLIKFFHFILRGDMKNFDSLATDLETWKNIKADSTQLFQRLERHMASCAVHELRILPSQTTRTDIHRGETRLVTRLRHKGGRINPARPTTSSAPIRPAELKPVAIDSSLVGKNPRIITNGVDYFHHLINVSELSAVELACLPLLLFRVERMVPISGTLRLSAFLFSYAAADGGCCLVISFKARALSSYGWNVSSFERVIGDVVARLGSTVRIDDSEILELRAQLVSSVAALGLNQCHASESAAAATVRLWSGHDQLSWLTQMLTDTGSRSQNECVMGTLASRLSGLPQLSIALLDGQIRHSVGDEVRERFSAIVWNPRGRANRFSSAALSIRNFACFNEGDETTVIMRMALSIESVEEYAAICVLSECMNEEILGRHFRDMHGAYGAFMGIDFALDQVYVVVQRPPGVMQTLHDLSPTFLSVALSQVDNMDYLRCKFNCLTRLAGTDSELNMTIASIYNRATLVDEKLDTLRVAIRGMSKESAFSSAQSFFCHTRTAYFVGGDVCEEERMLVVQLGFEEFTIPRKLSSKATMQLEKT